MSEPVDLLARNPHTLAVAREILSLLQPQEREEVEAEARAKGVPVEVLVARAIGMLAREAELFEVERRDDCVEIDMLPHVVPGGRSTT